MDAAGVYARLTTCATGLSIEETAHRHRRVLRIHPASIAILAHSWAHASLPSLQRSIQPHIGLNMKLSNTANVKGIKIALAR